VVPPNWLSPSHGVTPSLSSRWSGKSPLSFENLRTGLKRGTCNAKGQAKPSPNVKAQMTNEIQNPNDKDFITPLAPLILRGGKTRRLLRPEKAGLAMTMGGGRGRSCTTLKGRTTVAMTIRSREKRLSLTAHNSPSLPALRLRLASPSYLKRGTSDDTCRSHHSRAF